MRAEEIHAVLSLCLLASFADGDKHARERAEIRRVAEGFSQDDVVPLSTLYQDVLMKRVTLPEVAAQLESADAKRLGYKMAVCVCDADGALSDAEQRFLAEARIALGLDTGTSAAFTEEAQSIAALPVAGGKSPPLKRICPPQSAKPNSTAPSSTQPSSTARSSCCPRRCRPWRSSHCR